MANEYEKIALATRKKVSKLTLEQQKHLLKLYGDSIGNLASQITRSNDKSLNQRLLTDYQKELKRVSSELAKDIKSSTEDVIAKAAKIGTETEQQIMSKVFEKIGLDTGDHFTSTFSQVQNRAIEDIISGNLYKDKKTLSQRIWNHSEKFEKDIQYVINQGILEKKSALELARDLEQFVREPAKRSWEWRKVYPNMGNTKIDYNAQRLARTSINHAYQNSSIQSSNMNPFVEGIEWRSALVHGRTCDLCFERHGQVFPKDDVPLDHPSGMCTMLPHIPKDLDAVADELKAWIDGSNNLTLDKWYNDHGDHFSGISIVKSSNTGYNKSTQQVVNYIDRRKLTKEEIRKEMDIVYQDDYSKILNDKDKKNIEDYQIKTFTPYNDFLRGRRSSLDKQLMEGLDSLRATTSKATIKEDMILSRGTTINALEGVKWEDLKAGEILTEKAFMSASARDETARKFAKKKKDRGVLIDIQVKKGNKAVFVDTAVDYNWESEFIFPPGTKLEILEKWEDKGLKRIKGVIIDA